MNENLYKKLLELQRSVRALGKNAEGHDYQYVSGSKLLYFVRPKMDELGLLLIPTTVGVEQQIIETRPATTQRDGTVKPAKNEVLALLHKQFTWVDVESGESLTTDFIAQGCNGWDKAIGSAETYAERYYLLKFFHIATDEDDVDAIVREEPEQKGASLTPDQAAAQGQYDKAIISDSLQYKPLSKEAYEKLIAAYANGKKTNDGQDLRRWFCKTTHAGNEELSQFDNDVHDYKAKHNIQ